MRQKQLALIFKGKELLNYLRFKEVFARKVHDKSVIPLLSQLTGNVIEVGAGIHNYSDFAALAATYIRSDYAVSHTDDRIQVEATNIQFEDCSFDGVVCMSALEHIENYEKALSEFSRILKPGGKLLLNVPWLFPFHGAPGDYFRFSSSALTGLFEPRFKPLVFQAVGNYWISQATFLQRPRWSRIESNKSDAWYDLLLRGLGVIFILIGARSSQHAQDDNYALLYNLLLEKN